MWETKARRIRVRRKPKNRRKTSRRTKKKSPAISSRFNDIKGGHPISPLMNFPAANPSLDRGGFYYYLEGNLVNECTSSRLALL
jgi:hypothetical protein